MDNRAKDTGPDCDTTTGGPLTSGITFGIATEHFDVDEAIKGLELLKATGVDLGERGPDGRSLLDKLRDNSPGSQIRRETAEPLMKFLESNS